MRNDGGGVGGEDAAHGESEIGGQKMEDRPDLSWFFVIYADSSPHQPKNGTGTYLRGFLR